MLVFVEMKSFKINNILKAIYKIQLQKEIILILIVKIKINSENNQEINKIQLV